MADKIILGSIKFVPEEIDEIVDEIHQQESLLVQSGIEPCFLLVNSEVYEQVIFYKFPSDDERRRWHEPRSFLGYKVICNPLQSRSVLLLGNPEDEIYHGEQARAE